MSELTMPRTAADMQPAAMAAFYDEALAVGSFDDSTTGTPVFARYDDVRRILGSPDEFGNALPGRPDIPGTLAPRFPLGPNALGQAIGLFSQIPANTAGGDGPDHHRNRRVMEDLIPTGHREAAERLGADMRSRVDHLLGQGFVGDLYPGDALRYAEMGRPTMSGVVDVMPGARELTMSFIADFLGFPKDPALRRELISGGADQIGLLGSPIPEDQQLACLDGFTRLWVLTKELVAGSRPGDGNYTERSLAHTTDGRPTLEDPELETAGADVNLTVAGFSTLSDSITSGMRRMAEQPEEWEQARANPAGMGRVARELLRLHGGIYAWWRVALRDVEVNGREIKAGTPVGALIGAANRDPRHYGDDPSQDPNRLIPDRRVKSDVAFGSPVRGRENQYRSHFCVGAGVAQVAMTEVFAGLARTYPDFKLVQSQPPLKHNVIFLEHETLPFELGRRAEEPVAA